MTAEQTLSTVIFRRLEEYYYGQEGELEQKLEPVIALYKEMLERDPNANHLRLALGKLYMKLEKYDEAERMFMEFQREDASIPQVHLLLADLYQHNGNIDKALEEYRISAELVDIKIADFKCYHCGAMYEYWADHCSSCGSWGSIEDIFFKRGPQAVLPELKQTQLPQLPTPTGEEEGEGQVISTS
jgi:tetratricopeptide (TPR) repeat protein